MLKDSYVMYSWRMQLNVVISYDQPYILIEPSGKTNSNVLF